MAIERERYGWQLHYGVTVAECPVCAFCMDAGHTSAPEYNSYICPCCTPPPEDPNAKE